MNLFYSPSVSPPAHVFDKEESGHIIRVLRFTVGDRVHLTDGKGTLYEGEILVADPKRCEVILNSPTRIPRNPHILHLAIAPTKNINRFEWFLEKATEIGIDAVTPLLCTRSERAVVKTDRLQKILVTAMKQSLKAWLPELHEPERFSGFIRKPFTGQKLIAYCGTGEEVQLQKVLIPGKQALILIGPEGDFSPEEVNQAREEGFTPVSLGPSRLRTETAGVVACVIAQLMPRNEQE